MTNTDSNSPPTDRIRLGTVQAAIWQNRDTDGRAWYGVTLERSYRDGNGEWQYSTSLGRDDLLVAAKALDLAHTRIHELQQRDRDQAQQSAAHEHTRGSSR